MVVGTGRQGGETVNCCICGQPITTYDTMPFITLYDGRRICGMCVWRFGNKRNGKCGDTEDDDDEA